MSHIMIVNLDSEDEEEDYERIYFKMNMKPIINPNDHDHSYHRPSSNTKSDVQVKKAPIKEESYDKIHYSSSFDTTDNVTIDLQRAGDEQTWNFQDIVDMEPATARVNLDSDDEEEDYEGVYFNRKIKSIEINPITTVSKENAIMAVRTLFNDPEMGLLADSRDMKLTLLANLPKITTYELNDKLSLCTLCVPPKGFAHRNKAIVHIANDHNQIFCPVCFELIPKDKDKAAFLSHLSEFHIHDLRTGEIHCLFCQQLFHYDRCYPHISSVHLKVVDEKHLEAIKNIRA